MQPQIAMKCISVCAAILLIAALCSPVAQTRAASDAEPADQLFKSGKFDEARDLYRHALARTPNDEVAVLQLGRISLLANKLDEAQDWLHRSLRLDPNDTTARILLAETLYRRDEFTKAAEALNGIDVATSKLIIEQYPTLSVAKLESFKGQTPYELQGAGNITRLKFVNTGPLPVVNVRVNGGEEVTFFIDTGGSEVGLDTDFAKELGLPDFGKVQGTFSGGEQAEVGQSRIEQLTLGDFTVHNLPIMTLPFRQLSSGLGVKRIDGVIGTTLLYHFLATLDYPKGELVLRRKDAESQKEFAAEASGKSVTVPIWMASDHFMVGFGRVESLPPALLFVDTGLAGAGVKLAENVIKDAGIKLEEDKAYSGEGAGGTLKIVPYTVRRLSFGDIEEKDVPGLYDGPFPWEKTFGFHLAGMVGHDFFKPYAVTFDFDAMQIYLRQP